MLYLASEAKALFAAGIPARWDRAAFFRAPHHYAPPPDRSLFEGVHQVPAGHYLIASGERLQLVRYWDFDYPTAEDAPATRSDAEYAESGSAMRLDEAVRLRLRADVPGRLLPERRARFLRRAGTGGAATTPGRSGPSP